MILRPGPADCRIRPGWKKAKKVSPDIDFPDALYDEPDEEIQGPQSTPQREGDDPEEAILQMNMLGHQFFLFRDDATGEINVVYRRKNGITACWCRKVNKHRYARRGPAWAPSFCGLHTKERV